MNEQNLRQPDQEQQTRVIAPVDAAAPSAAPVRRRRADRYRIEQPQEEPAAEQPQEAPAAEPAARVVATRYGAQAPQQPEGTPAMGVPRPAALSRAQDKPAPYSANSAGVRRPVSAPGYSQRQPLGQARQPMQTTGEQPRLRRPYTGEVPVVRRDDEEKKPVRKGNALLVTLIVIVLVLGLAVLGILMIPEDDSTLGQLRSNVVGTLSGMLGGGEEKKPVSNAQAMDFSAAPVNGTAPIDVAFTLTTTKSVSGVRVVDELGVPLSTSTSVAMDNADSRIWMLNLALTEGYTGVVQAQIQDGEEWLDTGKTQTLEIAPPQQATGAFAAEPTATPDPTPEPVAEPTAEPVAEATDAPTQEPTQAPTQAPTEPPAEATPTMEPTATPTIAPTPVPTPEPTATPEPTPEPTPGPTATPALEASAAQGAEPSLISSSVIYKGSTKVDNYDRAVEDVVKMPASDMYITQPYGVMTFRSNAFRQNASVGNVGDISTMTLKWTAEAGSVKGASSTTYYGIGWTGQPAIVKWSTEVRAATNIVEEKKNTKALKEVIVAGMDGRIYFLDLADGLPTREAINLGYPMKGTPSIHPLGYPIMTVGQYARKMAKGTGDIGLRFYDLLTQKEEYMIDGLDGKLERPYYAVGAFDTSALIDPTTDTLITAGTNGMVYLTKMNTEFDYNAGTIDIEPESVVMKSKTKGQDNKNVAVESSLAAYGSYIYYADMSGVLRCVDTSSLKTVWAVETGDSVQAAIALDFDAEGQLWLYTANTLQRRNKGDVTIRRYNAMTGEESWALPVASRKNGENDKVTGAMASPVIGQYGLSDLVVFTLSNLSKDGAAAILGVEENVDGVTIALNKSTGKVVWAHRMDSYCYSSPVAVYSKEGKGWIIQAEADGKIYLLDGLTGKLVSTLDVEGTIEGSPAVYGSTLVIGTTGKNESFIYGITLE